MQIPTAETCLYLQQPVRLSDGENETENYSVPQTFY